MKLTHKPQRKTQGINLIESMLVVTALSLIAAVTYFAATNISTLSDQTRFERDVVTLNAAVRTYIATGGNLSNVATDSQVIAKLKQSLSDDARKTQVGSGGSLIDPRLTPVYVSENQAAGKPRATWNSTLQRFEIRHDKIQGFSGFKLSNDAGEAPATEGERHSRVAYDTSGGWIWPVGPDQAIQKIELAQIAPTQGYGGPGGFVPPSPTRLRLNPPTFSEQVTRLPLTTFPLELTTSDTNPAGTSKALTGVNTAPLAYDPSAVHVLDPGDSVHGIAVSIDPDNWEDSDYVSKTYDTSPYALSLRIETPQTAVTYPQVGGAMIGSFPQVSAAVVPTLVLENVASQISPRYTNSKEFQIHWVNGDSDPITDPGASKLPIFKRMVPSPEVDISLPVWGGTTSLRIRAAAVAVNTNNYSSSPVVETTINASPLDLPAPIITRSDDGVVTMTLDTSAGNIPENYRIFYTTDGTAPPDNPLAAEIYTGPIELPRGLCSTSSIDARAYGPEAYESWFTPSGGTQLVEPALADSSAAASFICRYNSSGLCHYTWLALGSNSKIEKKSPIVDGPIGIGPGASLEVKESQALINGEIHLDPAGTIVNRSATATVNLSDHYTNALTLAAEAAALTPTQSFPKIDKSKTITGTAPYGMNVIAIQEIDIGKNEFLMFNGDSDDYFIVVVDGKIKIEDTGKLVSTGSVDPSRILVVVPGGDDVLLKSKNGAITASILAPLSKVEIDKSAVYAGTLITGKDSKLKNEAELTGANKFGECSVASPTPLAVIEPTPDPTPPAVPVVTPEIEPPGPGVAGGHFDLDTSSFLAPFGSGSTDKHIHEYDDKYDVTGADFFNLIRAHNISDDVPAGTKFKLIIVNPDLSPGGRLVINSSYDKDKPATWVPVQEYANTPIADLPVYTHTNANPTASLLTGLGIYFDVNAIANGLIVPTNTGDVRSNVPGKYGEWRNGALTIQAVKVNADNTDAFTTSTAISSGGVQGGATSGLLWEATLFWHWRGGSYHEADNPHQPTPYVP